MERATKLVVLIWTCAALAAVIYFIRSGWGELPLYSAIGFVGMAIASAITPYAIAVPLLLTYVFPIVIRYQTNQNYPPYNAVWIAALLGAMLPNAIRTSWHVPARWRPTLASWCLVVVVSGTVVTFREFDFTTALLYTKRVSNSSIGGWPAQTVAWCLYTAVVLLAGILWFDWLCAQPKSRVSRTAILPLAISFAITALVSVYQLFVDVTFLNPTVYGALGRASGLLMDGNVLGVSAAIWLGAWLITVWRRPLAVPLGIAGAIACWLAVWASGSRTGFAAAAIVSAFAASAWLTRVKNSFGPTGYRRVWLGLSVTIVGLVAVLLTAPSRAVGPIARFKEMLPALDRSSLSALGAELWNRNGYGRVANEMIRTAPLAGVGVGGFVTMHPDYFTMAGLPPLPPDNAQNWYKQQLVELGIVGSIPWAVWVVTFGLFVMWYRANEAAEARIARGMLIAFAAISLVGVPTQDVLATLMFWTAAFFYIASVPASFAPALVPADAGEASGAFGKRAVVAMSLLLAVYTPLSLWRATTTLRVPVRAQRVGWPYVYGFYDSEPDGSGGFQRWTTDHGVIVFEAPTRHMLLTVRPNALAERRSRDPMRLRLEVNREVVLDREVVSAAPVEKYVDLTGKPQRVMIEARVNRTFRPSTAGLEDTRDLGLLLQWKFMDHPPANANVERGSDR